MNRHKRQKEREAIALANGFREYAMSRLSYEPETGIFVWRSGQHAGKIAGTITSTGHRQSRADDSAWLAHRPAWLFVYGEFPEHYLDRKNQRPDDNRLINLHPATHAENLCNKVKREGTTSKYRGVTIRCSSKSTRWVSMITANGEMHYLGTFEDEKAAARAYDAAAAKLHGEFANLNFKPAGDAA